MPALPPELRRTCTTALPAAAQAAGLRLRRHLRRLHRAPACHPLQRPRRRPARPPRARSSPVPVAGRRRHRRPAAPAVRAGAALARSCLAFANAAAGTQGPTRVGRTGREPLGGNLPEPEARCRRRCRGWGHGASAAAGGAVVVDAGEPRLATDGGEMAALMEDETKAEEGRRRRRRRRRYEAVECRPRRRQEPTALCGRRTPTWPTPATCSTRCAAARAAAVCFGRAAVLAAAPATFGRDGVQAAAVDDGVVALLRFVKAPLSLSPVQSHLIAFAEATFVTHRRHPRVVDLAAALLHRVKAAADTLPHMSYAEAALFHASARAMRGHCHSRICTPPLRRRRRRCSRCARRHSHLASPRLSPRSSRPSHCSSAPPRHVRAPVLCTQPSRRSAAPTSPSIDGQAEAAAAAEIAARTAAAAVAATEGARGRTGLHNVVGVRTDGVRAVDEGGRECLFSTADDSASVSRTAASVDVLPRAPPPAAAPAPSPAASPAASAAPAAAPAPRRRTAIVLRARACSLCDWIWRTRCAAAPRASAMDRPRRVGGGRPPSPMGGTPVATPESVAGHARRLARPPVARGGARCGFRRNRRAAPPAAARPAPLLRPWSASPLPPNLIPPPLRDRTPTQRGLGPADASPLLAATAGDPELVNGGGDGDGDGDGDGEWHDINSSRRLTAPPTSAAWQRAYSGVAHSPAPRRPPWRRRRPGRRPTWRWRRPPPPEESPDACRNARPQRRRGAGAGGADGVAGGGGGGGVPASDGGHTEAATVSTTTGRRRRGEGLDVLAPARSWSFGWPAGNAAAQRRCRRSPVIARRSPL